LNAIPQRVFDIWYAYYQCEPFGSHWEQTATIAAMLSFNNTLTAAASGSKLPAASVLHFMPSDAVPWRKRKRITTAAEGITDAKQQQMYLFRKFGFQP